MLGAELHRRGGHGAYHLRASSPRWHSSACSASTVFRLLLPLAASQPPRIVEDLGIVAVYVGYGFVQLRGAGVDLASIVTTSAILTAVIAFAMQDTLGNVLAGLAMQLDNSVRIGDWIKRRHRDRPGARHPLALDADRDAQLGNRGGAEQHADEGARRDPRPARRRAAAVAAPAQLHGRPGVPPARVIAIIDDEMRELSIPNVARTPAPSCVLKASTTATSATSCATSSPTSTRTTSPTRWCACTCSPRCSAPASASPSRSARPRGAARPGARRDRAAARAHPRGCRRSPRCRRSPALPEDDQGRHRRAAAVRAVRARRRHHQAGQQGALALHPRLRRGRGALRAAGRRAAASSARCTPGEFFGEMALITGEARTATVMAKTDVECYRLDRASFQELLLGAPRSPRRSSAYGKCGAATSSACARRSATRRRGEARCACRRALLRDGRIEPDGRRAHHGHLGHAAPLTRRCEIEPRSSRAFSETRSTACSEPSGITPNTSSAWSAWITRAIPRRYRMLARDAHRGARYVATRMSRGRRSRVAEHVACRR